MPTGIGSSGRRLSHEVGDTPNLETICLIYHFPYNLESNLSYNVLHPTLSYILPDLTSGFASVDPFGARNPLKSHCDVARWLHFPRSNPVPRPARRFRHALQAT